MAPSREELEALMGEPSRVRKAGWGLSAADIEEAVGFGSGSSSSSPTGSSGRVHAVEEVRGVLLPVLEARLRMQAEALAAYCHPQVSLPCRRQRRGR
jgi:hypothetical protein